MSVQKLFVFVCFQLLLVVAVASSLSAQLVTGSAPPRVVNEPHGWVIGYHGPRGHKLQKIASTASISGSVMNWTVTFKYVATTPPNMGLVTFSSVSNATITSGNSAMLTNNAQYTVSGTSTVNSNAGVAWIDLKMHEKFALQYNQHYWVTFSWNADVNPDPVVNPRPPVDCGELECGEKDNHGRAVAGKSILCPPNPLLRSLGTKTDFRIAGSSGASSCQSCSGGGLLPENDENLLVFSRKFVPANQASIGNCSPGVYFNYDYRIEFYQDYGGKNLAIMFDPVSEKVFYYEYEAATSSYVCKVDINGATEDFNSHFGDIKLENSTGGVVTDPTTIETQSVYAVVKRRNGWEYRFEVVDVRADPADDVEPISRLTSIKSPTGKAVDFTYKYNQGHSALNGAPKKILQMDTITDEQGNVGTLTYASQQKAGRWVVSDIDISVNGHAGAVNRSLRYTYNSSGHLHKVYRDFSGTEENICTYSYGTDTPWQAATIVMDENFGGLPEKQTIFVSQDYRTSANELVNQFANHLVGAADGAGNKYLTIFRDSSTADRFRVLENGVLSQWQAGVSLQYFESFDNSGSGQGYSGFGNLVGESKYSRHQNTGGGTPTAQQAMLSMPLYIDDSTPNPSVACTYDSNGNLTRLDHNGGTWELWQYDSANALKYYRDRGGFVTLTERDANQRIVRIVRGLKDVSGPGSETSVAGTTPVQAIRGYYGSSHANAGLLQWQATNAYVAGAVVAPAADVRTDFIYYANDQLKEVLSPLVPGQSTRPKTTYVWSGEQLASMVVSKNPVDDTTLFQYDSMGRLVQTSFPDGTTEQTYYATDGLTVYKKDRANTVQRTVRDIAGRVSSSVSAYATDADLLDGNTPNNVFDTVHDIQIASTTNYFYNAGETNANRRVTDGKETEFQFDYKGRTIEVRQVACERGGDEVAQARRSSYVDNQLFSQESVFGTIDVNDDLVADYTRRTYYGYSADGLTVRTIQTATSSTTFADNAAVLAATRQQGADPAYIVNDAIRDLRGNIVDLISPNGASTFTLYDGLNRQVSRTQGYGTSLALTTGFEYDVWGNVVKTTAPSGAETTTQFDLSGNYRTGITIAANDSLLSATSQYTYDSIGRPKTEVAPGTNGLPDANRTTETFYGTCCGQTIGTMNALGHGQIQSSNARGNVVHAVSVSDYATHTSLLNPLDAKTLSESTTRYLDNGRVQYRTLWKVPLDEDVNRNLPQIAGLSKPASSGLTTQYVYDSRVGDGLGLDGVGGASIVRVTTTGTSANVSIAAAVTQLGDTIANGGAGISLAAHHGSASVTISPDEKTMSVSISDAAGRAVMNATMTGPAATTPNQLVDWTCTQHDQVYNLTGFGNVEKMAQIDRDGNLVSRLSDGFGWAVGSLDQDSNLTRTKFDTLGNPLESVNALSSNTTFIYDLLGRQVSTTNPVGTTSLTYDSAGRVASNVDARGNSESYTYDLLGRKTMVTDRHSMATTRYYDRTGSMWKIIDAEGRATQYAYDNLSRRTTTTLHNSSVTTVDYDDAGRRSKVTKDSGIEQRFAYQTMTGLLEKIDYYDATPTLVGTDTFSYDTYLRPIGSTSRDGVDHTLAYSELGQLASDTMTYENQSYTVSNLYDERRRPQEVTYPSGRKTAYGYTNRGQLDTIDWDGSEIENRVYDALGRMTSVDRAFTDETRVYDNANRLISIDNTNVGLVSYEYDVNNNKLSETWTGSMAAWNFTTKKPSAPNYQDGYNLNDEFVRFNRSGQSEEIELSRNDIGNIWKINQNGNDTLRSFGSVHELNSIGGVAQQFDSDGNLTLNQYGISLGWNEAGLMKQATVPVGSPVGKTGGVEYGYDATGKRAWKKFSPGVGDLKKGIASQDLASGTGYIMYSVANVHSRLAPHSTQADHLVVVRYNGSSWQYDTNNSWVNFTPQTGDRLLAVVDFGSSGSGIDSITPITTQGTHAQGINQGYTDSDLVFTPNFWNGVANDGEIGLSGTWFSSDDSVQTVYVYAGPNCIAEYPVGTTASSPDQEYVYGNLIDSLVMIVRNGGSEKLNVTRNQQWSITALSDNNDGTVVERYAYDIFGRRTILAADGSTLRSSSLYDNPYGYTSRRHDDETGLCYFRARYFDPTTGEFCSLDPLGYVDGMSRYRGYFGIRTMDPSGLTTISSGGFLDDDSQSRAETIVLNLLKKLSGNGASARTVGLNLAGSFKDPLDKNLCVHHIFEAAEMGMLLDGFEKLITNDLPWTIAGGLVPAKFWHKFAFSVLEAITETISNGGEVNPETIQELIMKLGKKLGFEVMEHIGTDEFNDLADWFIDNANRLSGGGGVSYLNLVHTATEVGDHVSVGCTFFVQQFEPIGDVRRFTVSGWCKLKCEKVESAAIGGKSCSCPCGTNVHVNVLGRGKIDGFWDVSIDPQPTMDVQNY